MQWAVHEFNSQPHVWRSLLQFRSQLPASERASPINIAIPHVSCRQRWVETPADKQQNTSEMEIKLVSVFFHDVNTTVPWAGNNCDLVLITSVCFVSLSGISSGSTWAQRNEAEIFQEEEELLAQSRWHPSAGSRGFYAESLRASRCRVWGTYLGISELYMGLNSRVYAYAWNYMEHVFLSGQYQV